MAKRYGCKYCGKWFTNPHELGGHMNAHKDDNRKVSCPGCGKNFESVISMRSHTAHCKDYHASTLSEGMRRRTKPEPKFILTYDDGDSISDLIVIGSMKKVIEQLKVDSDMEELPPVEDIKVYELGKELKVKVETKTEIKIC